MKQIYGPFNITGGLHEEDVPSGLAFKVKALEPSFVVGDTAGKEIRFPIDRGAYVLWQGTSHALWRGDKRVAITELVVGDDIELCHSVTYGPVTLPKNLRRPDGSVIYDSFMSSKPLDQLFNRPNAIKFVRATEKAQADEIAELRRANEEAKQCIAELLGQIEGGKQQLAPPADPLNAGKPQQQGKQKQLVP